MKNLFFFLAIAFAFSNQAFSQTQPWCGFDTYVRQNKASVVKANKNILQHAGTDTRSADSIKITPVVVHVLHNNGPENISDAQIESQIRVLNEDYGKLPGTNGDGPGVDTKVRFCLAQRTPDGKCTNGIVRIQTTLTAHKSYERPLLSQLSSWDPSRYLNIYIVKTIDNGSTLGYASYPGGPVDQDGLTIVYNTVGDTGVLMSGNDLGRTATHEIGHWFGVYHTFNNNCGTDVCSDGDYVCDTPPVATANFGCPTGVNSCSNDAPDLPDQIANYMDYTDDACKNMFTQGQADRMHATLDSLRFDVWQPANLLATGCDSSFVATPCNAVTNFVTLSPEICVGNSVLFYNLSLNEPTSFQWTFDGGVPATSTALNPTVNYANAGTYDVTLITTNALGTDTLTLSNYIVVNIPPVGLPMPYHEGFESPVFPTNGITIENTDNGITWERDTIAVHPEGIASAKINNLININYGQTDAMVLPGLDLTTFGTTPFLSFRYAYAKSDALYTDQLVVFISTDCGANFTQIFTKSGNALATGPVQTTPYIPDSSTVWKTANVNLSTYASSTNAILKIMNVTDGGNNLYVDDLDVGFSIGIDDVDNDAAFRLYPNPSNGLVTLETALLQKGQFDLYVTDVLGQTLSRTALFNDNNVHALNLQNLSPGLYFIRIDGATGTFTRKIFIQR